MARLQISREMRQDQEAQKDLERARFCARKWRRREKTSRGCRVAAYLNLALGGIVKKPDEAQKNEK